MYKKYSGWSRRDALKGGALITGASLVGFSGLLGIRAFAQGEGDDVETMLNLAATAETLACTLYYTVLSAGIIAFKELDVVYMKAALDAELQHLEFLNANGGKALTEEFYFPDNVFADVAVFVATTESLETAFVGAYLAATRRAAELGNSLLATTAAQVAAIEAQHLALIRLTGDILSLPPNHISLAETKFYNVSDAAPMFKPFLEGGDGFAGPETYFGAEAMREMIGDGGVKPILPAIDPDAFAAEAGA